jgi:hypothetical protein
MQSKDQKKKQNQYDKNHIYDIKHTLLLRS